MAKQQATAPAATPPTAPVSTPPPAALEPTETVEVVETPQPIDPPDPRELLDSDGGDAPDDGAVVEGGDPGDENVEIVPVGAPAPELEDEDLQQLAQFGINGDLLREQFGGDPRKAYRAIAAYAAKQFAQQQNTPAPTPSSAGAQAMPAAGFEFKFDPDRDGPEKIVELAKSAYEHNAAAVQQNTQHVRDLESKFNAMQSAYASLANQHAASRIREIDGLIGKLPPIWKGTLGQGGTAKLDRKSPEWANRQKLVTKVLQMEREALAAGDVPDMEQLFETARTSLWTTQVRREIAEEHKQKLKQSAQRTIQRPAVKRAAAPPAKNGKFSLDKAEL